VDLGTTRKLIGSQSKCLIAHKNGLPVWKSFLSEMPRENGHEQIFGFLFVDNVKGLSKGHHLYVVLVVK
jgi:hypothetical protein